MSVPTLPSPPGFAIGPVQTANAGYVTVTDSSNGFNLLDTASLNVSYDIAVNRNFNNRLSEKTVDLFSPVTFNDAMVDSYYSLNFLANAEEGNPLSSFALPIKSFITEASVVLTDVIWTPDFQNGLYLNDPTKPVTFNMGYQIDPIPPTNLQNQLTYDSTGFSYTGLNAPGVIFSNAILKDSQPENGGGLIVSAGNNANTNANIGGPGISGNTFISPIWIQLTVPGEPGLGGKKIVNSANLKITLTTKIIQS
jgi:hypothetical protein